MKFNELSAETWTEQHSYFDTCVIPFSGLDGSERPFETTKKLSDLQKTLDVIERLYRGRTVIYPACHYMNELSIAETISNLRAHFSFVIGVTSSAMPILQIEVLDTIVQTTDEVRVKAQIEQLWQSKS